MQASDLKDYIVSNGKLEQILESLGCHHIRCRGNYYSCGNPDGDNPTAICVYNPSLTVVDYTRDLDTISQYHDIFTLIQYFNNCNFFDAIRYVCDCIGISTYHDFDEDLPESIILTRLLAEIIDANGIDKPAEKEIPLKPISERILSYYIPCINDLFLQDGITAEVQTLFEIGYDPCTNRITIPIRNYDGVLVGVKGRFYGAIPEQSEIQKYTYLEPCRKGSLLYGLNKSMDAIQDMGFVYVGESEKFVMQLFSYGDMNCVATGGKTMTNDQISILSRICPTVVLCFDSDVEDEELEHIADRFPEYMTVLTLTDTDHILAPHESPSDNIDKWRRLRECRRCLSMQEPSFKVGCIPLPMPR